MPEVKNHSDYTLMKARCIVSELDFELEHKYYWDTHKHMDMKVGDCHKLTLEQLCWLCESWQASLVRYQDSHIER